MTVAAAWGHFEGMNSEVGRYLEGRRLEMQRLLLALHDVALGAAEDVEVRVEGRELVFARSEGGRGFLRLVPGEVFVVLSFPRGHDLFDPRSRLTGPPSSQLSMTLRHVFEIDPYVRRLVEEACNLD